MKHIWKLGSGIIAVILVGAVSILVWNKSLSERQREAEYIELQNKLYPLEQEKSNIRRRMEDLKTNYTEELKVAASVSILFTDLDENIYTSIYPEMKRRGFVGVLALPVTRLLDQDGCLSREQLKELMDAGWKCCLKWEKGSDYKEWKVNCEEVIRNIGIERPPIVYFPYGSYRREMDDDLADWGIEIIIHHGEESRSLIMADAQEQIWYPGARGFQENLGRQLLTEVMDQKGNIIYTVGSDFSGERYDQDPFTRMLGWFYGYQKDDKLIVTDIWGAREYRRSAEGENDARAAYEEQLTELEEELTRVDEEIRMLLEK